MYLKNILPPPIIIHIFEYSSENRENLKNIFDELHVKASVKRMEFVWKLWNKICESGYRPPDISFLIEKVINDPEHIISGLLKCNCCYRHSLRKPTSLYDVEWIEYDELSHPLECMYYNKNCDCVCRNSARWLCRTFNREEFE